MKSSAPNDGFTSNKSAITIASRLVTISNLYHGVRTVLAGLLIVFLWSETPIGAAIIGVLFFLIFPFLADYTLVLIWPEPKGFPACPNGCCTKGEAYKHRVGKGIQSYPTLECGCGIVFLYYEKRFMRLDSDGIAHPYILYKNKKEKWVQDTGDPIDTKTAVLCAWAKEMDQAREQKKLEQKEESERDAK